MSHFKIIQLSSDPVEENKTINETDIYDDPLFEQQSDWGGDTCEYDKVIHRLARELAPVADIDKAAHTITFKDPDTIADILVNHAEYIVRRFKDAVEKKAFCAGEYELRTMITEPCGIDDLFHLGHCKKASTFLAEYLTGYWPRTMHIGAILDAHC